MTNAPKHKALKQKMYGVRVSDAVAVIDEWLAKDKLFYWDQTPEDVKQRLFASADENGVISLQKATMILTAAETSKLCSPANAGMVWIREHWRVARIEMEPVSRAHERLPKAERDRQRWIDDTRQFQRIAKIPETSEEELGAEWDANELEKKERKERRKEENSCRGGLGYSDFDVEPHRYPSPGKSS